MTQNVVSGSLLSLLLFDWLKTAKPGKHDRDSSQNIINAQYDGFWGIISRNTVSKEEARPKREHLQLSQLTAEIQQGPGDDDRVSSK